MSGVAVMGLLSVAGAVLPGCVYGDRLPEPSVGGFARTTGGTLVAFSCDGPVEELHLVPKGTSPEGWEAFHPGELWVTAIEPDRGTAVVDLANPTSAYEVLGRLREGSGLIATTFDTAGGSPGGGTVIEFDPAGIRPGKALARGQIVPTDEFLSQPACEGVEIV